MSNYHITGIYTRNFYGLKVIIFSCLSCNYNMRIFHTLNLYIICIRFWLVRHKIENTLKKWRPSKYVESMWMTLFTLCRFYGNISYHFCENSEKIFEFFWVWMLFWKKACTYGDMKSRSTWYIFQGSQILRWKGNSNATLKSSGIIRLI